MSRTQTWPPASSQPVKATPGLPIGNGPHSDSPELVGYARVSVRSQKDDTQLADLTAAGCARVFLDHGVSGKHASRPELDKAIAYMRPGDTFVITRLSRAMRSLKHLLTLTDEFQAAGIGLKVLKQDIDTTTSTGRLVFRILGAIDEWQRELIVEGTLEGLEAARAKGNTGGTPRALSKEQEDLAMKAITAGTPIAEVARSFGVSRPALYRALQRRGVLPPPGTEAPRRDILSEADRATILAMLKEGHNYTAVAEATGFSDTTAQRVWQASGAKKPPPGAGRPQRHTEKPPAVSTEDARTAIRLMEDGKSMAGAAKAIGATRAALYRALGELDRKEQQEVNGS